MIEHSAVSYLDRPKVTTSWIVRSILLNGFLDLFRAPRSAADYWLYLARALLKGGDSKRMGLVRLPNRGFCHVAPNHQSVVVDLLEYQCVYGEMPRHELEILCKIVRLRRPKSVFEIGTFMGGTALHLALNSDAQIYTLDLPESEHIKNLPEQIRKVDLDIYPEDTGARFRSLLDASPAEDTSDLIPYVKRIHQLFGDSRFFDFAPFYNRVDLLFVDGCHHYDYILNDSYQALKMVSEEGMILWHDYASYAPGVVRALNEIGLVYPLIHIRGTTLVVYDKGVEH